LVTFTKPPSTHLQSREPVGVEQPAHRDVSSHATVSNMTREAEVLLEHLPSYAAPSPSGE
jgi:hypothetical protein